jgi:hypothetical protein
MKMHDKSTVRYSEYKRDNLITGFKTYNSRSSKSTCSKPCSGVLKCTIFVGLHETVHIVSKTSLFTSVGLSVVCIVLCRGHQCGIVDV